MKFGAHLPTSWRDYGASNVCTAITEAAKAAEALSFDAVWANDTTVVSPNHAWAGYVIEPLVTLASLVHLVSHIKLGTSVLVLPQRNVFLAAKQLAALDLLSNERLILGIGVGWREEEFKLLNASFEHRAAMTDEAITVLRTLWREPLASFNGQFYKFQDVLCYPKPKRDHIPMWIGGNARSAIRRAAQFGDAWVPFGIELKDLQSRAAYLRESAKERGRQCPILATEMIIRIDKPSRPGTTPKPAEGPSANIAGSPDFIAQALKQYRQCGLEYLICIFEADEVDDLLWQMQVFAEQIAPRVTDEQ